MADRIILSDESINSYGYRVLTKGIDLSAMKKNPVMLYDHRSYSYLPIGTWKSLRVEGDQLTAEPVFDMEDEQAATIAGKYERKILNAASIGIEILAWSDDPADMVAGQSRPTVTKCKLYEASIVPIPSNTNAVRLYRNGEPVDMSDAQAVTLAFNPNKESDMEGDTPKPDKSKFFEQLSAKVDTLLERLSGKKPEEETPPAPETPQAQPDAEVTQLKADLKTKDAEIAQLKADKDAEVKRFGELKKEVDDLKKEIGRLSAAPAADDDDPTPAADAKDPQNGGDPFAALNARATEKFKHLKKN